VGRETKHEVGDVKIEVRVMTPGECREAAGVAARGMRDNPMHRMAFGPDPDRRVRAAAALFRALFAVLEEPPRVALRGGFVVGVAGSTPPGGCQLPPAAVARLLLSLAPSGVAAAARTLRWLAAWGARDLAEPHRHVGPVAVEGGLQGLGIGSRLLAELSASLDARGETAWLETDKPENVAFYGRFGFAVAAEETLLGVRCWFMRRDPRS
jgi:ribosomal protein S18 acetylase RimI-like enzyme